MMLTKLSWHIGSKLPKLLSRNLSTVGAKRLFSCSAFRAQNMEEKKINVDGLNINYLRVGSGQPVLLMPGAVGSIWTDFKPQIENLDRREFTVIGWDPPGYGKSRPPSRTFPDDFYHRDAEWAHKLMKALGYSRFSVIGWSDGGITALILSATHPESVKKQVALAANAYVTPKDREIYLAHRNIDNLSERMRSPYIEVYGEEYFRKIWSDWVDAVLRIDENQNGNLCKELLPKIRCPTLIVQGTKDVMCPMEYALYLRDHIQGAKLEIFEEGNHNLHLRYPEKFNALVTEFLKDKAKI